MKWQDVRIQYPDTWLLIEALKAHTTPEKERIVDNLIVIDSYKDFFKAMDAYKLLHREKPNREMYVVHTVNKEIQIKERYWSGISRIHMRVESFKSTTLSRIIIPNTAVFPRRCWAN